ncbi:LADA_0C09450g1_1 [Lachancea dasiensis]|uniref:LADA_0C09450g1_1 n=1 Tax=Lachancea dasiensis TaxID=1072105 RepID=A0A1G4J145_9SACH|nr:LADA_0C09450g1_1 [Lachancea dasiensis]
MEAQVKGVTLYKKPFEFDPTLPHSTSLGVQQIPDATPIDPFEVTTPVTETKTSHTAEDSKDTKVAYREQGSHLDHDKEHNYTLSSATVNPSMGSRSSLHGFKAPSPARKSVSGKSVTPSNASVARPIMPAHTSSSSSASSLLSVSPSSSLRAKPRRLSSEEIINEMEKEQDAIVVRLLREIDQLKDENNRLRKNLTAVLNGDPQTPAPVTTGSVLPSQVSRRPSLNSNVSDGSFHGGVLGSAHNAPNINVTSNASSNSTSVLALTPNCTSPVPSRRPSSSAVPIDTLTPTLLLQRKRNSVPSPVPFTPKMNDEFPHLYSPLPAPSLANADFKPDAPEAGGYRRRRLSMKSSGSANKIPRSTK